MNPVENSWRQECVTKPYMHAITESSATYHGAEASGAERMRNDSLSTEIIYAGSEEEGCACRFNVVRSDRTEKRYD